MWPNPQETACSGTVLLIHSALTLLEEVLLGKPKYFMAFLSSFDLLMQSFNLFSKQTFFLFKSNLWTSYRAKIYDSLSICNLDF